MKRHDEALSSAIAITLRTGILLAVSFGVLGYLFYLPATGMTHPSFHRFEGSQIPYSSLRCIARMMMHPGGGGVERGQGIAEIGVLVLMATPILRVVLSLISFLRDRDILFAAITAVVLGALGFSVFMR
ncbi:DUF1634 domain-containing protein [Granulicella tundricola]|uniref:DUF1634 domain-containing protein n=1 Tax=Granulicella tundricola (strain ATCC BAA-1859 / DSM 23138 / MP5ACTX9) TaxID=1198114 RepID=E8X6Q8_GRATM|nr:DUF1634 domain-containing protein [Granulicella tundricola]ADW71208.1 protein of unknown function DUF1634 [Granulicella tundricola MP5ACTX9]